MKKSQSLYVAVIAIWILSLGLLVYNLINNGSALFGDGVSFKEIIMMILLVLNAVSLSYFWLNSIKDFLYSLVFAIRKKHIMKKYDVITHSTISDEMLNKKFILLYCTCNDFNSKALAKCMKQNYSNFETIILDDSSKEEYKKEIDEFASSHNVEVVRRIDKTGFKAGNLNSYLKSRVEPYDYFVVLDSDEIIPSNFLKESLKYFNYSSKVGVVQACHLATEGENAFQSLLGMSIDSTSLTVQIMKNFYGSNSLIGHGMAISKECYEATSGFPLVVAEDISFAVELKKVKYDIIYAPNIICNEEFPNDYISLKKRQCKWIQGNVEYMKKYSKDIDKSGMAWFEKLDIRLSHFSLPIVPMLSLLIIICTILIGFLGYDVLRYVWLIFALSILFLLSPLLPNLFVYIKTKKWWLVVPYYLASMITYAGLAPMMIKTVILGIFGKKAKFIVTPKGSRKIPFSDVVKYSLDSVIFAIIIGVLTYFSWGTIWPSIILTAGCVLTPIVIILANFELKHPQLEQVETSAESQPEMTNLTLNIDGQMVEETDESKDENEVQDSNENQTTEQIKNQ